MRDAAYRCLCAGAIVLAGFVAYANTLGGAWVWDDASSVLLHEHVQDPSKFFQLFTEDQHAFGRGEGNFYRPLLSVTFMADFLLSFDPARDAGAAGGRPELQPFVFHLQSLLWHIAAALGLLLLLIRLGAPRFVQAAVPLLFVLHPLHTEAVAYISGRADMMSGAFIFFGLYLSLHPGTGAKRGVAVALGALCFAGGLLSKESSLIFPVLLVLLLILHAPRAAEDKTPPWFARLAVALPSIVMVLGYIALRMTVLRFGAEQTQIPAPLGQRLVETCQAFAFYIQKLFLPTGLHMEQTLASTPLWTAIVGVLLLLGVAVAFVAAIRFGQRRIAMGLAWFIAAWLPISGIFPLNAPMAEHWMYVPMAGFWWALAEAAWLLAGRVPALRPAPILAAAALCLLFTVLTVQRNADWHDNVRLFRATLAENPESRRVQYNLAVAYEDLVKNEPGAARHFRDALELTQAGKARTAGIGPDEIEMHLSLGRLYYAMGDYRKAYQHYRLPAGLGRSELYKGQASLAAFEMGRSLLALGNVAEAGAAFQQALSIAPAWMPEVEKAMAGAPL